MANKTTALESLEVIRKKTIDLDEEWRGWWLENHELLDDNDWWKKPAFFGVPRLNDPGEWSGQAPSKAELDAAITAVRSLGYRTHQEHQVREPIFMMLIARLRP